MGWVLGARSVGLLFAIVTIVGAGPWSAASAAGPPAPEELAPSRVAFVSGVPRGTGTITKAEFRHALVLSSVQAGLDSPPEPGRRPYEKLKTAALQSQLEGIWIVGQAAEWNIYVTRGEVKRELAWVKKEGFKSAAEFRRFLKEARYTHRDLHERIRTQILSTLLQERLQEMIGKGAGRKAEQRAFTKFVEEFTERWRSRTVCAPGYVTERCSNGPSPDEQG
jgi:hypothetical protein